MGFYLDVGKVHPVEVGEHLVDLGGVLEDGPGRLGQVVQAGVASQSLSKRADHGHLRSTGTSRKSLMYAIKGPTCKIWLHSSFLYW